MNPTKEIPPVPNRLALGLISALFLAGCGPNETAAYAHDRLLIDRDGCVFYARNHLGDTMFLRLIREQSATTCPLTKAKQ